MTGVRPMFRADWTAALFVHFAVDPKALAAEVPFELDTRNGKAFISAVAFTQSHLRPARGGRIAALLSQPLAQHEFLNLRAYVRVDGQPAIYFISEWIPNRLAVLVGPQLYGLPYRLGRLSYRYESDLRNMVCQVTAGGNAFTCEAHIEPPFTTSFTGSVDEFFVERYVAYTEHHDVKRRFAIDHVPWPQVRASVTLGDISLLTNGRPWMRGATFAGANFSPGVHDVAIGPPVRLTETTAINSFA